MARVRILKVVSEDPWLTEPLWESEELDQFKVFEKFDKVLEKYMKEGWECFDYGSASYQLCVRGGERVLIYVRFPESELDLGQDPVLGVLLR